MDACNSTQLPDGWECRRIDELGTVQLGRQRSPGKRSDKFPTKYLRAANVTWGGLALDDVLEMEFTPAERETFRLRSGDILLSEASGSASEVGKPALWNEELDLCCFQNTLIRFRPAALAPRYALHLFSHLARSGVFVKASRGVGIHHIGAQRFSALDVPVPPHAEQERIADRVEECLSDLAAGVAALERVRKKLQRYRAAVLHAAVTGRLTAAWRAEQGPPAVPGERLLKRLLVDRRRQWEEQTLADYQAKGKQPPNNWRERYVEPADPKTDDLPELPEGWCWASAEQLLVEGLCSGISIKGQDNPPGVMALKLNAISDNGLDYAAVRYIPIDAATAAANSVVEGDFFVSRGNGTLRLLARGTVAQAPPNLTVFPDTMIRFRLAKEAAFLPTIWPSPLVRTQIEKKAKTTAGIFKVNQTDLASIVVPLPPLSEHAQLIDGVQEKLSQIDALESEVKRGLARAARLRKAILKSAFAGELVEQNPQDEPASMLLERIRFDREAHAAHSKGQPKQAPRKRAAKAAMQKTAAKKTRK